MQLVLRSEQAEDLVHQGSSVAHEPVAHPVQRLQIELGLALQGDEPHGRSGGGLGDRVRILVVVLLSFDIGAQILERHEPYLVAPRLQGAPDMMGAAAGSIATVQDGRPATKVITELPSHAPAKASAGVHEIYYFDGSAAGAAMAGGTISRWGPAISAGVRFFLPASRPTGWLGD